MSNKMKLCCLCINLYLVNLNAFCQEYHFDPRLLVGVNANADLSVLESGGQLPGIYPVDIYINGIFVDSKDILFERKKTSNNNFILSPKIERKQLSIYGLNLKNFDGNGDPYIDISSIPGAKAVLSYDLKSLMISIPQKFMLDKDARIVPKELWNEGLSAFRMNYEISKTNTYTRLSGNLKSSYIRISPGINLGAWRVRNISTWQKYNNHPGNWQALSTFAERAIYKLNSTLSLGDRFTNSEVFDSVPFCGIMLTSDDSMVPSSQYMYGPVIRGIARTQARVEVKQNGYTLYDQVVAPGPFVLKNITPSGTGGNLNVTVWETDGHPQEFTVPFQTPAIAVKEGYLRYGLMAGEYRRTNRNKIPVAQITAIYGLPLGATVYGGIQGAKHFQSTSIGIGASFGDWGAISTDLTQSLADLPFESRVSGRAVRFRYSKELLSTDTTLTIADYQYDQNGYRDLQSVQDSWSFSRPFSNRAGNHRKKSQLGLTISQGLGELGSLFFSGSFENYRDNTHQNSTYSAGYSLPVGRAILSFNVSQSRFPMNNETDRMFSAWISMPLDNWVGNNATVTYRLTRQNSSQTLQGLALNGSSFDQRLDWGLDQQFTSNKERQENSSSLNAGWHGSYGNVSGSYSYGPDFNQEGLTVDGGMIIHAHGATFTQPLSDTVALIEAPGASGISVENFPGEKTDFMGFTIENNLIPYRYNTVSLDPISSPMDVDLKQTDINVIPTKGAIVPAKFVAAVGHKVLFSLKKINGENFPFGSLVTYGGKYKGIVDLNGVAYMTGLPPKGTIKVKSNDKFYTAHFDLTKSINFYGINKVNLICK